MIPISLRESEKSSVIRPRPCQNVERTTTSCQPHASWFRSSCSLLAPPAANGQTDAVRARAAAVRALPMLQRSVRTFVDNRSCVSCHHNSVAVLTLRMAQRQHLAVDAAVLDARRDEDVPPAALRDRG